MPTPLEPPSPTLAWLNSGAWFHLNLVAASSGAVALTSSLIGPIADHERAHQGRKTARRDLDKLGRSVSGILGGMLLEWLSDRPRPVFRSLQADRFTDEMVSRRDFGTITAAMIGLGYLQTSASRTDFTDWDVTTKTRAGLVTRFWPTPVLVELAASFGITDRTVRRGYRQDHARTKARASDPVTVTAMKEGFAVRPLPCDATREPFLGIHRDVTDMNTFAAGFAVTGCTPPRWTRTFKVDHRLGGRWWAAGGGYQRMRSVHRLSELQIAGEAVAEVDLAASHLAIMLGLLGLELPADDPYAVDGIPRSVAKAWTTATLGSGKPVRMWSDSTRENAPEVNDYRPKLVAAAMQARFPFLKAPADAIAGPARLHELADVATPAKLLPHRLMAIEAEGVTLAMQQLRSAGILALPVHDSLIVPASSAHVAAEALVTAFASLGIPVRTKTATAARDESTEALAATAA